MLGVINGDTPRGYTFTFESNNQYFEPDLAPDPVYLETIEGPIDEGQQNYLFAGMMNNLTAGMASLEFVERSNNNIKSITLQGSFLKVFDLDPQESVTIPFGGSIPIKVQSQGHDYFMIRSNQCKNCLDNLRKNTQPLFSNVLAVIPAVV